MLHHTYTFDELNSFAKQHDPTCLESTRVAALREVYVWGEGGDGYYIFWLSD